MSPKLVSPALKALTGSFQRQEKQLSRAISLNRNLSLLILLATLLAAYTRSESLPSIYMLVVFVLLLVMCVFSAALHRRQIQALYRLYVIDAGRPGLHIDIPKLTPLSIAVKKIYFYVFLCWWLICLSVIHFPPVPFKQGIEPGKWLWIGSGGFLLILALLFIMGVCRYHEVNRWRCAPRPGSPVRIPFSLPTRTSKGKSIYLDGVHMPNPGKQPLILWPGFFQNGHVWDLVPGDGVKGSLAEYLWNKGFDIWMIHSRGTAGSSGRWSHCTMDDYAVYDIPHVIDYVSAVTGGKPVYVGHSQGGKTAIVSMMGAVQEEGGDVSLSETEARRRQDQLKAMVTFGSFPDLSHSSNPWLYNLVHKGVGIKIFGLRIPLITTGVLLFFCKLLRYLPMPVGINLRRGLLRGGALKYVLAPLYWIMELASCLELWEFLYHIPNASKTARRHLFYRSMDGTYYGILNQFQNTVRQKAMTSCDGKINYSENYHRLTLPVSFVGLELDYLADPVNMEKKMFNAVSSRIKYFTTFRGVGHEDIFFNPHYYPWVYRAIQKVNNQ